MTTSLTWISLVLFFTTAGCASVGSDTEAVESDSVTPYSVILSSVDGETQEEVVVLDSDAALEETNSADGLIQEEVVHLDSDEALDRDDPEVALTEEEVVVLECDSLIEEV